MGTWSGFVAGYLLGVKHGPEGYARVREAVQTIVDAPEVRKLLERVPGLADAAARGVAGLFAGEGRIAATVVAAISSPPVAPLVENGLTLLHGVVERGMATLAARERAGGA